MKFEDCTPGVAVVYRPHPGAQPEDGEVVRQSTDGVVFVQFVGDRGAKACFVSTLEPAHPEPAECTCGAIEVHPAAQHLSSCPLAKEL